MLFPSCNKGKYPLLGPLQGLPYVITYVWPSLVAAWDRYRVSFFIKPHFDQYKFLQNCFLNVHAPPRFCWTFQITVISLVEITSKFSESKHLEFLQCPSFSFYLPKHKYKKNANYLSIISHFAGYIFSWS